MNYLAMTWTLININFTLMFTLQCELTDDQTIKSESSILMTIANKVELVSKELNHFGGIASFFRDWAPKILTGGK